MISLNTSWKPHSSHLPRNIVLSYMPQVPLEIGKEAMSLADLRSTLIRWPKLIRLGQEIRRFLDDHGICIIRRFPLSGRFPVFHDNLFLLMAISIGEPVPCTEGGRDYVIDITSNYRDRWPKYGEGKPEEELHTDSIHRVIPEDYVGRLVIRKCKTAGGRLAILDSRHAIRQLESTPEGQRCLAVLSDRAIPILVPNAFTGYRQRQDYIFAPVVSRTGPLIRFHYDAMRQSILNRHQHPIETLWALTILQKVIRESSARMTIVLQEGDILFLNNHLMLNAFSMGEDLNWLVKQVGFHARSHV